MGEKPLYLKHIVYTKYLHFGLGDRGKLHPVSLSRKQGQSGDVKKGN